MKRTEPQPRFVVCVNNKDYPASLELRKLYQVVADEAAAKHHQLRVIDESGEDYIPKNISSLSSYPKPPRRPCCARQISQQQNSPASPTYLPLRTDWAERLDELQ
jgi:hypothetical protein